MSTVREIPFFVYPDVYKKEEKEILKIVADVGRRGAFILQKDLEEFEQNLAEYLGIKHVIGVGNATDGLFMLARAAGIGPGDEVIFCSHTMVATAAAMHFTGATPVPVEAGWDHEIDPSSVENAITEKTKAILPTQLNGRCCDMDTLRDICSRYDLLLIEDSAQALGAQYNGEVAGSFGKGGVISFYPAKTLGCLGDGGCILTNDDEIAEKVRLYRDHGRGKDLEVECWALNSRLDNLQAAILNYKLRHYPNDIEQRRSIARMYEERLSDVSQLVLPPGPDSDPDRFDIFQNYEIEAERRDELKKYLSDQGIGTLIQWGGKPVHLFPKLGFKQKLPYTESLFERMLMLPMNTSLKKDDVDYICDKIKQFYGA